MSGLKRLSIRFDHEIFRSRPFLAVETVASGRQQDVYLVGGFLRDLALGRERQEWDLDFCSPKNSLAFGRAVARELKAPFVVLDRQHGCGRVVCRFKGQPLTLDFVDFRAATLKEDLCRRDFTINTLAVQLPLSENIVLDHAKASEDLRSKTIRLAYPQAFDEDPLRILRAFSLSATLGFRIAPATMSLIKKKNDLLEDVAGERLRDELFKILQVTESFSFIREMDERGILARVIPQIHLMHDVAQGAYHHLDVWGHSLETVRQLELLFNQIKDLELNTYLQESLAGQRSRRQVMKLAALLHDIGKPQAYEVKAGKTMFHGHERIGRVLSETIAERLKLSTKEKLAMDTMIFWHLRPGYLADNKVLTPRAVYRYFRDTKDEAVSVLLVAVADQRATRGPLATAASRRRHEKVAFDLIQRYFRQLKETPLPRLLGGDDLISFFHLTPGPVFSTILRAVEEEQVEGRIRTKIQARDFVRRFLSAEKKRCQRRRWKRGDGGQARHAKR